MIDAVFIIVCMVIFWTAIFCLVDIIIKKTRRERNDRKSEGKVRK